MRVFDVYHQGSGHSIGLYEAEDSDAALEAMARDAGYDDLTDMRLQTGLALLYAFEVDACVECQVRGEVRECYQCGKIATVIDCGHQPQPAVISAGRADGTDPDHWYCEDCGAGTDERTCYGCGADLDPHAGLSVVFCGACGDR